MSLRVALALIPGTRYLICQMSDPVVVSQLISYHNSTHLARCQPGLVSFVTYFEKHTAQWRELCGIGDPVNVQLLSGLGPSHPAPSPMSRGSRESNYSKL